MASAVAVAVVAGVLITLIGNLALDFVRGVPKRVHGRMERVLRRIPEQADRERWREELHGVMSEAEGRPWKQVRQGRELLKAAEQLVGVYRASIQIEASGSTKVDSRFYIDVPVSSGQRIYLSRDFLVGALENLSYRERRIMELRNGWSGEPPQTAESVGRAFNVLPERVIQIEGQAIAKIESLVEAERIRELREHPW
jgi:DNA-directed RNA polymerase specialized sigma subunit